MAVVAATLAGQSFAQAPVADGQWRGVAGASAAITSGNSSSQALLVNADMAKLTAQDKMAVYGFINEGKSKVNGTTSATSGKAGVGGQYDYNLSPTLFGFGKLGLDNDRLLKLSLRTAVGAGVGMHVIKTPTTTFDVIGGVGYVNQRYSTAQTIGGTTASNFGSTGLILGEESSHKLTDTVFFKQRLEYYPGLTGIKNDLIKFNAGLSVSMSKSMSLTVGLVDTYNSKVPTGRSKNDLSVLTGVSVALGN